MFQTIMNINGKQLVFLLELLRSRTQIKLTKFLSSFEGSKQAHSMQYQIYHKVQNYFWVVYSPHKQTVAF